MINFIAAIDSKRGIANEHGIPWQGKVPSDVKYYRQKLEKGLVLMGYGLYRELNNPYPNENKVNYVAIKGIDEKLKDGFLPVDDAHQFIEQHKDELVWNTGGALLFESTLDLADKLYLTQLDGDFGCTKFFPEFNNDFKLVEESEPITENGITFRFQVWQRK